MQRTSYLGLINCEHLNQDVTIKGWVHRRRDFGGVIFFDIRDRSGLIQVVVEPDNSNFAIASTIKHEYVVEITASVRKRIEPNYDLATGEIELVATIITILNISTPLPIQVDDVNTSEVNRLTNRIIDLRSQKMQRNLQLRYQISRQIRNFLDNEGFIDIETPFLTLSTPGGARDYLVPSRIHKGSFYALPQSPQVFKQLLMVAGFDRYYQIVRCFRDEELRADRQPEFSQIDIETSFLDAIEIRAINERMIKELFNKVLNVSLPDFPVLTYKDAMADYGVDKPDLRIKFKFIDLTHQFKDSSFNLFKTVANTINTRIVALNIPVSFSRKEIDNYTNFVAKYNLKGLAYIKVNDNDIQSPIAKFLTEDELSTILDLTNARSGDTIFFAADKAKIVNDAMGALRIKIAQDKKLIANEWQPLWVVDFPMFDYDESANTYHACHHPFTAPIDEHIELLSTSPEQCLSKAYDMVINGWEVGGGSVRIHLATTQAKVFSAMGMSHTEVRHKFGFLLDNLQYGAPPHGGIAFGLDRLVTLMCGEESIRDVIAFPKTTTGQCLLTSAPSKISSIQLAELGLAIE